MYEFLDKLISIALPGFVTFVVSIQLLTDMAIMQWVPRQLIFPKLIMTKSINRGMDIIIVTTTKTDEKARELLQLGAVCQMEETEMAKNHLFLNNRNRPNTARAYSAPTLRSPFFLQFGVCRLCFREWLQGQSRCSQGQLVHGS